MSKILESLEASASVGEMPGAGRSLLGLGLGAGLLGAVALGLRYSVRPPTKERIPETLTPARFTARSFQSSWGQMIYHEGGTPGAAGPTLVFIHNVGVGASSYEWSKVYPALAGEHRILAVDLLGFGESERPKAKLTAANYAAALAEFVGALCGEELQRPVVVARGLGGGFAALMAATHPEVAGRLLLWMPSGQAHVPALLNLASRVPILNSFIYRNRLARRATIRARLAAAGAFVDPAAVHEAVEMHAICAQQYQADFAIYRLFQGKMSFDLDARWRELQTPVTLLCPARASAKSMKDAERLQTLNRLCSLRIVPGVGPFAPLEAPGAVVGILREELQPELRVLKAS